MTTEAKKEFWQMTRREVGAADLPPSVVESVLETHERAVKKAIAEGKDVPAEVLKDYPTLQNSDNIITNKETEHDRENTGVLRRANDIHAGSNWKRKAMTFLKGDKRYKNMPLKDMKETARLKAEAAKREAENLISADQPDFVVWPRVIRTIILEVNSD